MDNKLVRRVAGQRLNRAITPRNVNISTDLCADVTVYAYDVTESLGGSPTDEPSSYFLMQAKFNAFYDVYENNSLRQPLIRRL